MEIRGIQNPGISVYKRGRGKVGQGAGEPGPGRWSLTGLYLQITGIILIMQE